MQGASGDLHREDDYVFRDDGKPYDCDVAFVKTIAKEESARCGGQPRHKAHPLTPPCERTSEPKSGSCSALRCEGCAASM